MKQRVLFRLGRLDQLRASGELDGLLLALGRFSEKYAVLGAHAEGQGIGTRTRAIGPALIFERLWRDCGIGAVLEELASRRRFGFELERAVFVTALHRLFAPGSDRAAEKWKRDYAIAGAEELELHQLYRTMGWLGEPVSEATDGEKPVLRTRCELIEERLFEHRRDLFSTLDLVFFDTTSIYFEGEGGESLGQFGHSKDHRPDLKQMVVGVVIDQEGRPLCSQMWPGNSADVRSLVPVVDRLRTHFQVGEVCLVADRGMISQATIEQIQARGWRYILGVRMRRTREANEEVLARAGRYEEIYPKSADPKAPSPLKVKEVWVENRRYVVCLNEDQAAKDFDQDKIQAEARFDGKWVLTTNTDLSARELALKYKQLWQVEAIFRTMKSELATRPIFHKRDDTIRGHVFCSFLALALRHELEQRLARRGWKLEWADIIRDLERLQQTELTVNGKGYRLRTETEAGVGKVFQACGVALPPQVQPL